MFCDPDPMFDSDWPLTAKGRQLARRLFAQHSAWLAGLFANLSPAERSQLARLLTKAAAGMKAPA